MLTSDALLWERWRERRDADAFTELVARHAGMVFATCRRVLGNPADAEDVAQDCFIELIHARPRVRESLAPWLHTVARRRACDRLKGERRRRVRERQHVRATNPADESAVRELFPLVDEAIAELPDKLRLPVLLRFLEGRTQVDVARALELPESTVASRLKAAVERIRSSLRRRGTQVSAGVVVAFLRDSVCEAAPATLTATLGKLALAAPGPGLPGAAAPGVTGSLPKLVVAATFALLALGVAGFVALRGTRVGREVGAPSRETSLVSPPDVSVSAREAALEEPDATSGGIETLQSEDTLHVLCVDEAGAPVADAEVLWVEHLSRSGEDLQAVGVPGPILTDTAGSAPLRAPTRQSAWQLGIFAWRGDGLAGFDSVQVATLGPEAPVEIILGEGRELAGWVEVPEEYDPRKMTLRVTSLHIDADGTSSDFSGRSLVCDGAAVRHGRWKEAFSTHPDSLGKFRFAGLPVTADVGVVAEGPGLGRARATAKALWTDAPLVLDLQAEGVIEGSLSFEPTGDPATAVPLVASTHDAGEFHAVVDGDGRFRFSSLPEAVYHISLPADFDRSEWTLATRGFVRASPGVVTGDVHLTLERGGLVSGKVTSSLTGEPIRTGVCAVNGPEGGTRPAGYARTGEDGRYTLRVPTGASRIYVCEQLPGYVCAREQTQRDVVLAEGEPRLEGIDFQLTPRERSAAVVFGLVRGRVVDPHGAPLPGVLVRSLVLPPPEEPFLRAILQRETTTDALGRYELAVPASGDVAVRAGGEKYGTALLSVPECSQNEAREMEDLVVRLATGYLAGHVVDAQGQPLLGVSVYGNSKGKNPGGGGEPARTDPEGFFFLEHLLEGEKVRVTASKVGYRNVELQEVEPGTTDLRITLERLDRALFRE